MTSSNFNLRNITPSIMSLLKKMAKEQKVSINSLILKILESGLGITIPTKKTIYHDLDSLAGTWSEEDGKQFEENIKSLEQIDKELWT